MNFLDAFTEKADAVHQLNETKYIIPYTSYPMPIISKEASLEHSMTSSHSPRLQLAP
jgi:hypothetical protein